MTCGAGVGQPGACPRVLAKLFTAAKWTGPADDGSWHSYDETWNCTDRKDIIGRVTEENGRLIWHLQDGEVNVGDDLVQSEESNSQHDSLQPFQNSQSRSHLVYVAMFVLLLALATTFGRDSPLRWLEW